MSTEEQRVRKRDYMRIYRLQNLERDRSIRRAQGQSYWRKNKEKIVAKRKERPPTEKDRERAREYSKRWREKYPDKVAATQKRYNTKNPRRGLDRLVRIYEQKAGRSKPSACEICGSKSRRIAFDHCHRTGKFRGWICSPCNVVLGYVKDDPTHLRKLIAYLERSDAQDPHQRLRDVV